MISFGFAPGQELSEDTSAKPAILHFLKGEAQLTLGEEGGILAKDEVRMLLYMLEKGGA